MSTERASIFVLALAACAADDAPVIDDGSHITVQDDALPDVNATSPRFGDDVRSSDYLGQRSAWYFGHAT